jgi:mevalonate kinase
VAVGGVRARYEAHPTQTGAWIERIGVLVRLASEALAAGDLPQLGTLMDENQRLLEAIGVSSPELETLIGAARAAGALGAKLSGGGMGGFMLALVTPATAQAVQRALCAAGAKQIFATSLEAKA